MRSLLRTNARETVVRRGGWRSPTKQLQFSVLWRSPLIPFPYSRRSHFVKSWNEAQSTARSSLWLLCGILGATTASVVVSDGARDDREKATHQYPVLEVEGHNAFETVIVGGGTAGCTLAYLLAKWMEEMDIPGTVLLVERGHDYSTTVGPDPRLKSWFDIWGGFGEAHMTIHKTGEHYPVAATDHRGLGGCSTHDTRINFQLTRDQLVRMAAYMGWKVERLQNYFQAALNLIPVSRAIPRSRPEPVHQRVIDVLTAPSQTTSPAVSGVTSSVEGKHDDVVLARVTVDDADGKRVSLQYQEDEFNTMVKPNSIAEVSMSMYGESGHLPGSDEVRYVSAYLIHEKVRPKNLKVLCDMTVDRVIFDKTDGDETQNMGGQIHASSVIVQDENGKSWTIQLSVCNKEGDQAHKRRNYGDVVIANGSLGATGLLQRSGIGPGDTLRKTGVEIVVDNAEVGHGVDHLEISLVHKWHNSYPLTRGGPTGWPLVLFSDLDLSTTCPMPRRNENKPFPMYRPNAYFQAHFGAGAMDPNYDEPVVELTPLIVNPDPAAGFRGHITSTSPKDSLLVVNEDQTSDLEALGHAMRRGVLMLDKLERAGVCGPRLSPPREISLSDMPKLIKWIKENHWTVYHWCSTCKAGLPGIGTVADENFRVRCNSIHGGNGESGGVINNLFIGSAASLPEITEPNPHLTITAFSIALAEQVLKSQYMAQKPEMRKKWKDPSNIAQAWNDLDRSSKGVIPSCVIRRQGEEHPALWDKVVKYHHQQWMQHHPHVDE